MNSAVQLRWPVGEIARKIAVSHQVVQKLRNPQVYAASSEVSISNLIW